MARPLALPNLCVCLLPSTNFLATHHGKSKAQWRRIGAVWKHKNLGSSITWDFTPVPTSPGRTVILPYAERKPDAEEK